MHFGQTALPSLLLLSTSLLSSPASAQLAQAPLAQPTTTAAASDPAFVPNDGVTSGTADSNAPTEIAAPNSSTGTDPALNTPQPAPDAQPEVVEEVAPAPAPTQLKIELATGTSIRFGVLWQGGYEGRGNSANNDYTHNLFVRRFSFLVAGTILNDLEYTFDTDFADLLKAPTGDQNLKNGPGISLKDAFATYRLIDDRFKIDGGLLMPPGSRTTLQSSSSLNGWDFFNNTFRHSTVFGNTGNPYGRDLGLQARGLLANGLLEYRLGIFQGKRKPPVAGPPSHAASRNAFRFAGRVQLNFLDPETNYFYGGTYLGKKKVFSIGGSADFQHNDAGSFRSYAGDFIVDVPAGPGTVTATGDLIYRNGGKLVDLPQQTALLGEAGYRIDPIKLSPIVRFEKRWGRGSAGDETDVGGGLAYWFLGHNSNLKAFYTRIIPKEPVRAFNQFNVQWQAFYF